MRKRNRNLVLSLGIAALCAVAILPAAAVASTASISIKRVFYAAAPGEVNDFTISMSGTDYALADPGAAISAGAGCTASGSTATCPGGGINGITVSGDDGADNIRNTTAMRSTLSGGDGHDSLEGGSGNDTLRGNQGVDTLTAGAGDDFVDVRGDRGDIVTCGDGADTVRADVSDSVAADCESVDRGGAPPPPPPGPTSGPSPTAGGLLGPVEANSLDPGACAVDKMGTPRRDIFAGTDVGENLFGLQGNDRLNGRGGDDCLFGGVGSDRLSGAAGDDRLLGDDTGRAVVGHDRLFGNGGDDLLVGGPGRDRLNGGAGNDRLGGGTGRNSLRGGPGNDRLNGANGRRDALNCGPGKDTARADIGDRVRGCERVRRRGG